MLYSVSSQAPHWWEAMGRTSAFHCSNGFRLPLESRRRAAISFWVRWTLKAAKTSAEWRRAERMGSRPGSETAGNGGC